MAKRLDTTLESEGAEFLVLGVLLAQAIPAYKAYVRNAGYDLIAANPDLNRSIRIEVKSRWAKNANWNMGVKPSGSTDYYVYVRLNREDACDLTASMLANVDFYVFPSAVIDRLPKTANWGQARLRDLDDVNEYKNRWDLISDDLCIPVKSRFTENPARDRGLAPSG